MANKIDLLIEQGTSWSRGFVPDLTAIGMAFDDSWLARAQVRTSANSSTLLHSWSPSDDNLIIEDGVIKLSVEPSESSAWKWTNAVYDLEISKDGLVIRLQEGKVKISPEVTK